MGFIVSSEGVSFGACFESLFLYKEEAEEKRAEIIQQIRNQTLQKTQTPKKYLEYLSVFVWKYATEPEKQVMKERAEEMFGVTPEFQ